MGDHAKVRVLIVDGYPDAADSMALLLRLWGYEVAAAYSGPTALDAAHAFRPDIVLTELRLPGADGFEVARRLRGQAVLVALTGMGLMAYLQGAQEAGLSHFFLKPVDPHQLRELLKASGALGRGQRLGSGLQGDTPDQAPRPPPEGGGVTPRLVPGLRCQ
jgi:CheY-like chemotaxis protein